MATNKRKDAAALFELIDRSTLKVPKNAGALKIPSWWSSKTNPPPTPATSETSRPPSPAAPAARTIPVNTKKTESKESKPAESIASQPRLFEPPPADVELAASPSIRPPTSQTPVPIAPALKVPPAASALIDPEAYKGTEPIDEKDLPPDVPESGGSDEPSPPRVTKVFAPQTYAQDRKPWSKPRPGSFACLPAWALISGMAGVVIVACIIVMIAKRPSTMATPSGQNSSAARNNATAAGRGLLPGPQIGNPASKPAVEVGVPPMQGAPPAGQPGKIYEAGTFPYISTQYYVIVCSTPSEFIAKRNAGWLTDRGINVAIEKIKSRSGSIIYAVVAVQEFPSKLAAEPFCQEIVKIGDSHSRGAWATAYPATGLSPATSRPAAVGRGP